MCASRGQGGALFGQSSRCHGGPLELVRLLRQRSHRPRLCLGLQVAHVPLLLVPWLSHSVVWFFSPLKSPPSLTLGLPLSVFLSCQCVYSFPILWPPWCLSAPLQPPLAPLSRKDPGIPFQPFQTGQGSPCSIPSSGPCPSHLQGGASLLRLGTLAGFQAASGWRSRGTSDAVCIGGQLGQPPAGHTRAAHQTGLTTSLVLFGRNLQRAPTPPLKTKTPKVGPQIPWCFLGRPLHPGRARASLCPVPGQSLAPAPGAHTVGHHFPVWGARPLEGHGWPFLILGL